MLHTAARCPVEHSASGLEKKGGKIAGYAGVHSSNIFLFPELVQNWQGLSFALSCMYCAWRPGPSDGLIYRLTVGDILGEYQLFM